MNNTAYSYLSNSKYLSSTNTDGACAGRDKPSYLVGAGTYPSVSYDWNGFDTVSGFNGYMYPDTKQAGDTNKTDEACSKGVDCSGYASRVWQLTTKKGTCTIEEISTPIPQNQLLMGDIVNKCNVHTVYSELSSAQAVSTLMNPPLIKTMTVFGMVQALGPGSLDIHPENFGMSARSLQRSYRLYNGECRLF